MSSIHAVAAADGVAGARAGDGRFEKIWLLVFDLDGTLIDSSRDLCASVNAALLYMGRPALSQELITSFVGDGASVLIQRSLRAAGASGDDAELERTHDFFLAYYREHKLDTTRLYPGVLASLQAIRAGHPELPMAVLTNKPVGPSREICKALDLDQFFFAIYGGDSFRTKKPHPEGLQFVMKEAQALPWLRGQGDALLPRGVVVVGDAAPDLEVARRCETLFLGCLYGLAPESLAGVPPGTLVARADEWQTVLGL